MRILYEVDAFLLINCRIFVAVAVEHKPTPSPPPEKEYDDNDEGDDDDEIEIIEETDEERIKALMDTTGGVEESKTSWSDFTDGFDFTVKAPSSIGDHKEQVTRKGKGKQKQEDEYADVIVISSSESETGDPERWEESCDVPSFSRSTCTAGNGKFAGAEDGMSQIPLFFPFHLMAIIDVKRKLLGLGNLVQSEIKLRKKESLGMIAPFKSKIDGRKLGNVPSKATSVTGLLSTERVRRGPGSSVHARPPSDHSESQGWSCLVCTL